MNQILDFLTSSTHPEPEEKDNLSLSSKVIFYQSTRPEDNASLSSGDSVSLRYASRMEKSIEARANQSKGMKNLFLFLSFFNFLLFLILIILTASLVDQLNGKTVFYLYLGIGATLSLCSFVYMMHQERKYVSSIGSYREI